MEFAEQDRRNIRERTHSQKERLLRNPQINILKLPNGVEHIISDECKKKFGPKTKIGIYRYTDWATEHVRPAFERYASGKESLNSIAYSLGFESEASLRYTLQNRWWIGYRTRTHKCRLKYDEQGKRIPAKREAHETPFDDPTNLADTPLVSIELFNRVQQMLQNPVSRPYLQTNSGKFLGTGFLVCRCGSNIRLNWDRKRNKPPVYVCGSHQSRWRNEKFHGIKQEKCTWKRIRAEEVDAAIWKEVCRYFKQPDTLAHLIKTAQKTDQRKAIQNDILAAEEMLQGLQKQKKTFIKLVAADPEDEDLQDQLREIKRKISAQEMRVATIKIQAQPFGSDDPWVIARAIYRRFLGSENWTVEEKRAALADVVECIRITDDNKAALVVRGGLPLHNLTETGQFDVPPGLTAEQAAKFQEDQLALPLSVFGDFSEKVS